MTEVCDIIAVFIKKITAFNIEQNICKADFCNSQQSEFEFILTDSIDFHWLHCNLTVIF